ncbi:hypothetical protein GCM10012275_47460 [Longimycelium tulufanense]|uniref:Uncharacterized protein n=1 Tax=Longimycelium tulufanense TaxID=907463 RepID=A0A8J3CIE5_9PSEU|nr:bacteriophage holin [Longimycelium tulufanense]GGM71505.1 hypothetical protein GCM10012275_47460 [Longimycelium tulufanense]
MPYLVSLVLVVFGLVVSGALVMGTWRALRRLARARAVLLARVGDRTGLLTARVAALRVAVAQRRRSDLDEASSPRTI